jgi:hypothetical protein
MSTGTFISIIYLEYFYGKATMSKFFSTTQFYYSGYTYTASGNPYLTFSPYVGYIMAK